MPDSAQYDSHGLPLSTRSAAAASQYRDGLALMLSSWPGADQRFEAAVAEDPGFALAHAALARLDAFAARPAQARARIAHARELAAGASQRERSHVEVLSHTITAGPKQALAAALAHAESWPRDILILGLPLGAFGLFAFSGMAEHDQARVELCERHAAEFGADDWWFLTYHGWALAEHGAVSRGRDMLERAVAIRPANANGVHALVHAMYEGGAHEQADAVIHGWLPSYDRKGLLHGHISWHAALNALERGDAEGAIALYLASVQPSVSLGAPINIVTDGASLLWRLDAEGHRVDMALWDALAAYAHAAFPRAGHGFTDVHMGFIEATLGDYRAVGQRVEALEAMIAAGTHLAGPVVPGVCRAALAFAREDYAGCVALLAPLAKEVVRIGGSGAQRDVIADMLLLALMRSGDIAAAWTMLDERLHRRPSARDLRRRDQLAGPRA